MLSCQEKLCGLWFVDKFSTTCGERSQTMDNLRLQHKFLEIIKSQVSSANFRAWFTNTHIESLEENKIILAIPSAFVKETLNLRHLKLIEDVLFQITGKKLKVEFTIKNGQLPKPNGDGEEDIFQPIRTHTTSFLNPKYTLENFVVGLSNNVAYAAAQAVIQNPGLSYNPLFLYGGTGVGKTHLMLAIGNTLLKSKPNLKIIYCPSETFMNDYVNAIQTHKMGDLRAKYRACDMLLVDDIQFFSGREGTQQEFFHTFNELQSKNSQMVLTSDNPPNEIAKLEDRLKSRFQGGLMVDIQPPDFDTRVAILKARCMEKGESLEEDALKLLASSLDSNIRELEGKLMQIMQSLKLKNLEATYENIIPFLNHQPKKKGQNPKQLLSTISDFFNLNLKDLVGPRRHKELVLPRHVAMYLLSEEFDMTVESIGKLLGGRDHTTVMHGRDKIKKMITTDREVQRIMIEVKSRLS